VTKKIFRKYLDINSLSNLKEVVKPIKNCSVNLLDPKDFQLNKFFYKNIGKKHNWVDRLIWTDLNWTDYVSNKKIITFILEYNKDIAGYFELILNHYNKEVEMAYFGILEEYFGKKLGGYLLSEAIRYSFTQGYQRFWVHTCSLDHKNALNNYLSRGMKVFKEEIIEI
jgi:ribosomal protein S18 acetylase RimI-like enzyme